MIDVGIGGDIAQRRAFIAVTGKMYQRALQDSGASALQLLSTNGELWYDSRLVVPRRFDLVLCFGIVDSVAES